MIASCSVSRCTLHAPAKLNLRLDLLGRRSDGFHELKTVMATVGLFDSLRVESTPDSPEIGLRIIGRHGRPDENPADERIPAGESNLVCRALRELQAESDRQIGAQATLCKRIPSQAGLGGGSSDAAAALVAGNRVWGLGLSIDRLAEIGARLGSDIPFFVHAIGNPRSRAALAAGRGERVTPFTCRGGLGAVIVKPPAGLSTPAVYAECDPDDYTEPSDAGACEDLAGWLKRGRLDRVARLVRNGLQPAAGRLAPWMDRIVQAFDSTGCAVHQLSGSGSAYFGLVPSVAASRRVAARLRALRLGQLYATAIG